MSTTKADPNRGELLVAIINTPSDFEIPKTQGWYRVPVDTAPKRWPPQWIAFYQTKAFGDEAHAVRYYGRVAKINRAPRHMLFPEEPENPKSGRVYYQVHLQSLEERYQPIPRRRWRRIVFIPTTWAKFAQAEEINDLFDDSPLEDTLWRHLRRERIPAERQWEWQHRQSRYMLDFAVFCHEGSGAHVGEHDCSPPHSAKPTQQALPSLGHAGSLPPPLHPPPHRRQSHAPKNEAPPGRTALTHKLFCYVDETGQDTQGRLFVAAVVVTESERDELREQCSAIEMESGKGQRKWVKSKHDRRLAYMRQVLKIPTVHGRIYFLASYDHVNYLEATLRAIAGSLRLAASAEFQATVLIDGLPRREEREVGLQLRRVGVPVKKVRGARDETDVLIRLADAVCRFVRAALEGQSDMRSLFDEQVRLGVVREVSEEEKCPRG